MRSFVTTALLVGALLLPQASHASTCLPGYQEDSSRFSHTTIEDINGMQVKVVNDKMTGLQWMFCPYGMKSDADGTGCEGSPVIIYNDANANSSPLQTQVQEHRKQFPPTQGAWRAPDAKELYTLYNPQCQPALYRALGHPPAEMIEQTRADVARVCVADCNKDPVCKDACRHARASANVLENHTFISDSLTQDALYARLHFRPLTQSFKSGPLTDTAMLRLVRPIPRK